MKKTTLLFTALVGSLLTIAQNFTATYSFDSVKTTTGIMDPSPLPTATGVIFDRFKATGTPVNPNSTARFSFTDWAVGATSNNNNYASLAGAVDTAEYYKVTIGPAVGYTLSLSDLTFRTQRSGSGIRTYAVRSSIDNFATNIAGSINPANANLSVQAGNVFFWNYDSITTAQDGNKITLGTNFTSLSAPVTFRFYGWNAEGTGGTFSIDNVVFNGVAAGTTGIEETNKSALLIYPNPSSNGFFTLLNVSNAIVTVYNILGEQILIKQLNGATNHLIDLSEKPNGSYFVNVQTGSERITKKIIVTK